MISLLMPFSMSFLIPILSNRDSLIPLQQRSAKRAADMVERAWRLTNVSVLLDSLEATARKVTLALLWGVRRDRKSFREKGNFL